MAPRDKEVGSMPLDENTRNAVAVAVGHAVDNKLENLFTRVATGEREREAIATQIRADRELWNIQLGGVNEKLDHLTKQLDGNGHGPLLTRLAVLERDMQTARKDITALEQEGSDTRSTNKSFWHQVFAQGVLPIVLSWLGLGVAFLIYLAFVHPMKLP